MCEDTADVTDGRKRATWDEELEEGMEMTESELDLRWKDRVDICALGLGNVDADGDSSVRTWEGCCNYCEPIETLRVIWRINLLYEAQVLGSVLYLSVVLVSFVIIAKEL